jgi:hypothetical protein
MMERGVVTIQKEHRAKIQFNEYEVVDGRGSKRVAEREAG